MIGSSDILSKLQSYSHSSDGKQEVKGTVDEYRTKGKTLPSGSHVSSLMEMAEAGDIIIQAVRAALPEQISEAGDSMYASQPIKRADGSYVVEVNFNQAELQRKSLYDKKYYEMENIVAAFNNGIHAQAHAYGYLNTSEGTKRVRSRKDRDGLHFMQTVVDNFNATYGARYGVTATLSPDYTAEHPWVGITNEREVW